MKNINFTYSGKKYSIKDYTICSSVWSQIRGLMFRSRNYTRPLLFVLKKPKKMAIHSFFCRKFIAVWLDDKFRVLEVKLVNPWKNYVLPKKQFNYLLEVPILE